VLDTILGELISSVPGASAAIFLDDEGEAIAQSGGAVKDIKIQGAWKEIHLDRIKEITERLGLGGVNAVLFSLDQGNELMVPVEKEYCLVLFLSSFADLQKAMTELKTAIEKIKLDIA
jgi:predicted regulator of Ras-like GTPase activity (Roadblock/LC7/MglB family)